MKIVVFYTNHWFIRKNSSAMAYKKFTLNLLRERYGLENRQKQLFSDEITPLNPSDWLLQSLAMGGKNPIKSEKARSEMIVTPILLELKKQNNDYFTIYSGETLEADREEGFTGECDFILSKNTQSFTISYPIFALIEAKRHDFDLGIDQCAAQMYGSLRYNQKFNQELPFIYGCVTTADEWLFLKLEKNTIYVDSKKYFLNELPKLLGVFQQIIASYKE